MPRKSVTRAPPDLHVKHLGLHVRFILTYSLWALAMSACAAPKPRGLGLVDGQLQPCPPTPNCVSSQSPRSDEEHYIPPFTFKGAPGQAQSRLLRALKAQSRVDVVTAATTYIHAEFTSLIFRFVDDVELAIEPATGFIHCRSASRFGYSDLGANRRRMEALREAFLRTDP